MLPHAAAAIPIYGTAALMVTSVRLSAAGVLLHVTWNVGSQGAPKLRAHLGRADSYLTTPQAIRSPALPVGSVV